jgi:DNA-binding PadR family transcriptional regulator
MQDEIDSSPAAPTGDRPEPCRCTTQSWRCWPASPRTVYELKRSFEQAVGDKWGGLNIGHLYQILDRLSRDQLIESQRTAAAAEARPGRPSPDPGRAGLERWLNEPSARLRGYRDDFFLKLLAAVQAGNPQTVDGVLRLQPTDLLRELHSLAEARQHAPSAVDELLITAAELHIRADLGVVDAAEKNLGQQLAGMKTNSPQARHAAAAAAGASTADAAAAAGTTGSGSLCRLFRATATHSRAHPITVGSPGNGPLAGLIAVRHWAECSDVRGRLYRN